MYKNDKWHSDIFYEYSRILFPFQYLIKIFQSICLYLSQTFTKFIAYCLKTLQTFQQATNDRKNNPENNVQHTSRAVLLWIKIRTKKNGRALYVQFSIIFFPGLKNKVSYDILVLERETKSGLPRQWVTYFLEVSRHFLIMAAIFLNNGRRAKRGVYCFVLSSGESDPK